MRQLAAATENWEPPRNKIKKRKILPLPLIHLMGNVITSMSLVSLTHPIEAMESVFPILLFVLFLGQVFGFRLYQVVCPDK